MIFDKCLMFADGRTIPATANSTTYSRVLDMRRSNEIDGLLRIWGGIVGAANTAGSVTTRVQFSDDGATWRDAASMSQDGETLVAMFLPLRQGRFMRLAFTVGATALSGAIRVTAGLVDQFDMPGHPAPQAFPPLENLAELGDRLAEPLVLAAESGSIAKGASGTVAASKGAITAVEAPAKYTVTVAGGTATIALASDAASGTVTFVDGLGNRVGYAVTAT